MYTTSLNKTLTSTVFLFIIFLLSPNAFAFEKAPDFVLGKTASKKTVYLSSYKGRVVYLDFWASWCVPCLKSFPWMNEMHNKYKNKGVKIFAVNMDENREDAKQFLKDNPVDFPILYDPEGKIAEQYGVQAMPSSYFIDKKGNLAKTKLGFKLKDTEKMEQVIKSLL